MAEKRNLNPNFSHFPVLISVPEPPSKSVFSWYIRIPKVENSEERKELGKWAAEIHFKLHIWGHLGGSVR